MKANVLQIVMMVNRHNKLQDFIHQDGNGEKLKVEFRFTIVDANDLSSNKESVNITLPNPIEMRKVKELFTTYFQERGVNNIEKLFSFKYEVIPPNGELVKGNQITNFKLEDGRMRNLEGICLLSF